MKRLIIAVAICLVGVGALAERYWLPKPMGIVRGSQPPMGSPYGSVAVTGTGSPDCSGTYLAYSNTEDSVIYKHESAAWYLFFDPVTEVAYIGDGPSEALSANKWSNKNIGSGLYFNGTYEEVVGAETSGEPIVTGPADMVVHSTVTKIAGYYSFAGTLHAGNNYYTNNAGGPYQLWFDLGATGPRITDAPYSDSSTNGWDQGSGFPHGLYAPYGSETVNAYVAEFAESANW